jgi:DNA helicase HerA-like ATPase
MARRTTQADTSLKAEHVYICGNSGTGKSSHVKLVIKLHKRVVVFDPDDEYGEIKGFKRVDTAAGLVALLKSHAKKPLKVAFVAEGIKAFEFWANCVFLWANCLAVAEEIADVTTPSKAPPAWGRLIRRGRKYGIKICAVTQRPAEADKTILCNAAIIRTCALGRNADREAIGREINAKVSDLSIMLPLEWVEFRRSDLSLIAGKLGVKGEKRLN